MAMKLSKQYYISVEGDTEKWYFEHLQQLINNYPHAKYLVKLLPKKEKSPLKFAKSTVSPFEIEAFHVCDYESNSACDIGIFNQTLQELKQAKKAKKNILYKLGYSNYTFELWMVLHKMQYLTSLMDKTKYLKPINKAYEENFETLDDYKIEKNFKRILSKITIQDVIRAVENAAEIRKMHQQVGHGYIENFGFKYYKDNPDLTINECVEKILKDCKVFI